MFGMSAKYSFLRAVVPQEQAIGYSLDGPFVHVAKLALRGKKIVLHELLTSTVKPLDIEVPKEAIAACALASHKSLARYFSIALTKPKDVEASFAFEAESHLPYPVENCLFDKVTLGAANGETQIELFAALKSDIQELIDHCRELGIDPEIICPKPLALCHFAKSFLPESPLSLLIDIDHQETTCVLVKNGLPLVARSHPSGLDALQQIFSPIDGQMEINEEELPHLHQYLREVARILLSFQNGVDFDTQTLPILFTGPVAENQILVQLIASFLNRQAVPQQTLSCDFSWEKVCCFAAPIGCALSNLYLMNGSSVNFRKDEFTYPNKWRRWKKELALYFSACCLLAGALYIWGESSLYDQRQKLIEKYSQILVTMEKTASEQELIALSSDELDNRLYSIEEELKQSKEEMALHPDVPRVSDILAWLSSHPKIAISTEDDDRSLKLESLSYVMVKRPEKGKLKEPYQVRVDLEFSAPTATMAREFHDALLAPNPFVDAKNELKWSVHRGKYRATFFLKDRTKYPQHAIDGVANAGH